MIVAPTAGGDGRNDHSRPSAPIFPPRRTTGAPTNALDAYLAALDASLAGQIDPALEMDGVVSPMGPVARAALLEAIGADLEAAVRDLMLAGVPRDEAEARAVAGLGPAPSLGRDLLVARRRQAVEAWERGRDSMWWWTQPLLPVGAAVLGVFVAALAPTVAVIAGMAAEPHAGSFAVVLVPLIVGLLTWAAGSMAPGIGGDRHS
ncbi:MAG: hypothetical protein ACRDI2_17385 [Chloroflexota bacterium]